MSWGYNYSTGATGRLLSLYAAQDNDLGEGLSVDAVEQFEGVPDYYLLKITNPNNGLLIGSEKVKSFSGSATLTVSVNYQDANGTSSVVSNALSLIGGTSASDVLSDIANKLRNTTFFDSVTASFVSMQDTRLALRADSLPAAVVGNNVTLPFNGFAGTATFNISTEAAGLNPVAITIPSNSASSDTLDQFAARIQTLVNASTLAGKVEVKLIKSGANTQIAFVTTALGTGALLTLTSTSGASSLGFGTAQQGPVTGRLAKSFSVSSTSSPVLNNLYLTNNQAVQLDPYTGVPAGAGPYSLKFNAARLGETIEVSARENASAHVETNNPGDRPVVIALGDLNGDGFGDFVGATFSNGLEHYARVFFGGPQEEVDPASPDFANQVTRNNAVLNRFVVSIKLPHALSTDSLPKDTYSAISSGDINADGLRIS